MTALSDAMRILKEVGEQVNGQLFADHVSCLRCMIWGKQSVSVLKLMMLSALSCEDCKITEERAQLREPFQVATYTLLKLRLALPKLAVKHDQVNGAKAF